MAYAYGAHGVEVEVDPETGKVNILNYVAAHDVGRAINPLLLEGQVYGGITMGAGYALTRAAHPAQRGGHEPQFPGL